MHAEGAFKLCARLRRSSLADTLANVMLPLTLTDTATWLNRSALDLVDMVERAAADFVGTRGGTGPVRRIGMQINWFRQSMQKPSMRAGVLACWPSAVDSDRHSFIPVRRSHAEQLDPGGLEEHGAVAVSGQGRGGLQAQATTSLERGEDIVLSVRASADSCHAMSLSPAAPRKRKPVRSVDPTSACTLDGPCPACVMTPLPSAARFRRLGSPLLAPRLASWRSLCTGAPTWSASQFPVVACEHYSTVVSPGSPYLLLSAHPAASASGGGLSRRRTSPPQRAAALNTENAFLRISRPLSVSIILHPPPHTPYPVHPPPLLAQAG